MAEVIETGATVRIVRCRSRKSNHTPCMGETGIVQSVPSNPEEPFGYAVHLTKPFELHPNGMTVCYHLDELQPA